jgi:CRISPR type IV-associated protein Csf2
MITRPDSAKDKNPLSPLSMNIVVNDTMVKTPVIPGETIKGLLRGVAYAICVEAATTINPDEKLKSLDSLYRQTLGGLEFVKKAKTIGGDVGLRAKEPILSLFGAANPKMTGRIRVEPAIARNANTIEGMGLLSGTRRDPVTTNLDLADMLSEEDKAKWARQAVIVSAYSKAKSDVDSIERRMKSLKFKVEKGNVSQELANGELEKLQVDRDVAEAEVNLITEDPEFKNAIARPIPDRKAAPIGTVFDHLFEVQKANEVEIGLFFAALATWSIQPRIGGGATIGFGRLAGDYTIEMLTGTGPTRDRVWAPAGRFSFGGDKPSGFADLHPDLVSAQAAWRDIEADILDPEMSSVFA